MTSFENKNHNDEDTKHKESNTKILKEEIKVITLKTTSFFSLGKQYQLSVIITRKN